MSARTVCGTQRSERKFPMENAPIRFVAEIADIPFTMMNVSRQTENRLKDYMSQKEPLFVIDLADNECGEFRETVKKWLKESLEPAVSRDEEEAYLEEVTIKRMLEIKFNSYGAFHFHSSAICYDGEAYLFTAPSGTGKSTHTRLWRERFGDRVWMINDDRPYLRVYDNGIRVYGAPWQGKHNLGKNGSAPLKAIAWLVRGAENHIEPLSQIDAFPVVMRETLVTFPDQTLMKQRLQLIKRFLERASFYKIRCNMETEAAEVALRGMKYGELR